MENERTSVSHDMVRVTFQVRAEQRAAIERLAEAEDLTIRQVTRRLLDLGLATWSRRDSLAARELAEVAS